MKNVIVVGGGAAGMMAAISAAENGNKVTLIEKNEKLGKKVFITGKGRCNVTNACATEDLFNNILSNPKFLYSSIYSFDSSMVMDLFENNGCKLKIERGERVFPVSDHSSDIIKCLEQLLVKNKVQIIKNSTVTDIVTYNKENDDKPSIKAVIVNNTKTYFCDALILASGGKSYASTGSDGNGYILANRLGHKITDLRPGLVPITIKEDWCKELMGLSLKNVRMTVSKKDDKSSKNNKKKYIYDNFGEMLFTHFGISGPLVLTASSYISKIISSEELIINIDLKPALTVEQLDKRILRDFDECKNKQFKNSLSGLLPSKLIPVIIELSGIDQYKAVNEITKNERLALANLLKNLTLTCTGTRDYNEAIITIGGVDVKEVDASTMESKLVNNLYFAGEMLDLDAVTGGFNLQIAWSTGHLAGASV